MSDRSKFRQQNLDNLFSNPTSSQPRRRMFVILDATMNGRRDHWRELCISAAFEDNPEKLTELVDQINETLTDRQEQLTDRIFERLAPNSAPAATSKHWIQ